MHSTKNSRKLKIVGVIMAIAILKKYKRTEKESIRTKRQWCREWLMRRYSRKDLTHIAINELQLEDPKSFVNFCRLTKSSFEELLSLVGPLIKKQCTVLRESVSATTRLLITLRYLATGNTYTDLSYGFRVSVSLISVLVPETLRAIYETLSEKYLKGCKTASEWKRVAKDFNRKWNFPFCMGAIDVGTNGRANDAAAFTATDIGDAIKRNLLHFPEDEVLPNTGMKVPYVFLSDDAFRLSSRILKPYSQRQSIENKIFNYRLSRARRVVENAFGILASRFQVFQKEIKTSDVKKVELITLTACVLHNFLLKENEVLEMGHENIELVGLDKSNGNRYAENASEVRDKLRNYFNNVDVLEWQNESVNRFNF